MILTSSSWLLFWLESCVSNLLRIRIIIKNNNSSNVLGVRLSVVPLSQVFKSSPWAKGSAVCGMLACWGEERLTQICVEYKPMCGATTKCCVSDFEPLVNCGDDCVGLRVSR